MRAVALACIVLAVVTYCYTLPGRAAQHQSEQAATPVTGDVTFTPVPTSTKIGEAPVFVTSTPNPGNSPVPSDTPAAVNPIPSATPTFGNLVPSDTPTSGTGPSDTPTTNPLPSATPNSSNPIPTETPTAREASATPTGEPTATTTQPILTDTPTATLPTATWTPPVPTPTLTATASPTTTNTSTATPSPTHTATPTPSGPPTSTPTPTSTPKPITFGALDHSIVYDDGSEIFLIHPDGSGRVALALMSSSHFRPRLSAFGQFVYFFNGGYWLGDILGHHTLISPPLAAGEQVYDVWPSPDGQYIAWQFGTPGILGGVNFNLSSIRIVLTDISGGNARTLLQQPAGPNGGDVPLIYGWRMGHPATLLVETLYGDPNSKQFLLRRGLEAFDPTIADLVGDFLPPLGTDTQPTGEVLGVSPSGSSLVFATQDAELPSGEGPFPVAISAMSMDQRHSAVIDKATAHHDKATKRLPEPRAYVFSRQAFISPDDTRIAYTRQDILYPEGAIKPYVVPVASLANLDGSGKADFGPSERVWGWADGHTVVVGREDTRENGLYAVNLTTGATTRILLGNGLRVDGIVP